MRTLSASGKRKGTVLVDDATAGALASWKLFIDRDGYARAYRYEPESQRTIIKAVHQFVGNFNPCCDHVNGNKLDNRSVNLRSASRLENNRNRPKFKIGTSRFKGVSWSKKSNRWIAHIRNMKRIHLGLFDTETEAALAYNMAAMRYHGQFASLNEI